VDAKCPSKLDALWRLVKTPLSLCSECPHEHRCRESHECRLLTSLKNMHLSSIIHALCLRPPLFPFRQFPAMGTGVST
jgi:hypothetical protein